MEEERVSFSRERTRNLLQLSRRMQKDEESDSRRSLKEISISSEVIADIAQKLKTKSAVTAADLRTLKNGLMDNRKHIDVFLNVHGALRGLVRELTGGDVVKLCLAAGCCCNLALGDTRTCTAVAKAAGSYLVAALDSLTLELAVTCAWTLGNLAGSGAKVCGILTAQGAVSKLSDYRTDENAQNAAVCALLQFAYQLKDELKPEHLQKILQTLSKLNLTTDSAQLIFVLSCHNHFSENIREELMEKLLNLLISSIEEYNSQTKECYKLVYAIRVLANCDTFYGVILSYCVSNNVFPSFKSVMSRNNVIVNDSLLWLLGNLYKYSGDNSSVLPENKTFILTSLEALY